MDMEDHTFKITHLENIKEKDGYYILPTESISKATLRLLLTDSIRNYLENGDMTVELRFNRNFVFESFANGPMFSLRKKHIKEKHYLGKITFRGSLAVVVP